MQIYCSTQATADCFAELEDCLAAYEDTGLTPAQIKFILPQQTAEEAVERMKTEKERYDEWFAWKQAEAEGSLIVSPCKVGEVVYDWVKEERFIYETFVESISVDEMNGLLINLENGSMFSPDEIGKTVFFSYEQAKEASKKAGAEAEPWTEAAAMKRLEAEAALGRADT